MRQVNVADNRTCGQGIDTPPIEAKDQQRRPDRHID
jgi:hypothetical protein